MLADLFAKRLVIVSGKGGVGKTVVSSALGLLARERGKRVLLVKMDDQGRTAQLFGTEPLSGRVSTLRDGISAINLDPVTIAADYLQRQLRVRRLVRHVVNSRLFQNWFRVSPAIKEMICLGKVLSLVEETSWWRKAPVYDLVIFDAPATGHGLGLLKLPEQASKLLLGPMRTGALAVGALLRDATRTALLLVTIPEEMPVNETIHFYEAARGLDMPLAGVVLNQAAPRRFEVDDPDALAQDLTPEVLAQAAATLFAERASEVPPEAFRAAARASCQRRALTERYASELEQAVDLPRVEVPFVFTESFGTAELERVASHLREVIAASEAAR